MVVRHDLGALVDVLPGKQPRAGIIHVVFPSRLLPSVRALLDFLAADQGKLTRLHKARAVGSRRLCPFLLPGVRSAELPWSGSPRERRSWNDQRDPASPPIGS